KYAACTRVLKNINILPFEGATIGRELYKEANLMQAIKQIEKKDYFKALSFIEDAKKWPENLGSGKPYQKDIDERLEDWISYLIMNKQGNKQEADKYLSKILLFTKSLTDPDVHIIEPNHLISAWTIERTKNRAEADNFIQVMVKSNRDSKILPWIKNIFENNYSGLPTISTPESGVIVRLLENYKTAIK
ncbi:MAG TPA: DUF5107 domain-containing protein, partial [Chryseobacterium sp.]|nr:DUF5107 domain-containing protein [Chryseobacterium sp.]